MSELEGGASQSRSWWMGEDGRKAEEGSGVTYQLRLPGRRIGE